MKKTFREMKNKSKKMKKRIIITINKNHYIRIKKQNQFQRLNIFCLSICYEHSNFLPFHSTKYPLVFCIEKMVRFNNDVYSKPDAIYAEIAKSVKFFDKLHFLEIYIYM